MAVSLPRLDSRTASFTTIRSVKSGGTASLVAAPVRIGLALALCLVTGVGVSRAAPVTLEDVIRSAMANNFSLQEEDEKLKGAKGSLQEAEGAFDWSGFAETGIQTIYGPGSTNGLLDTQTVTTEAWRTIVGIQRTFRNGISVTPGFIEYSQVGVSPAQTFGQTKPRPVLGLTIPLLRGRGTEAADAAEIAAQEAVKGTSLEHTLTVQRVLHDTVGLFWKCLADARQQQVLIASDQDADKYEAWVRSMAEKGLIEPMVAQRQAVDKTSRQLTIAKLDTTVTRCQRDLAQMAVGLSPDAALVPKGDWPAFEKLGPAVADLKADSLTDLALSQRLDLAALTHFASSEHAKVRGAENGTLPKLDLYLDPSLAYLRYTRSLEGNLEEGHLAQAKAAESDADLKIVMLRSDIRNQVSDAVGDLQQTYATWVALNGSKRQLASIIGDLGKRASLGVGSRQELREAQEQLTPVEHDIVDAEMKFAQSLADLRFATGTIDVNNAAPASLAQMFLDLPNH
jgi:outer membrane protein TolC